MLWSELWAVECRVVLTNARMPCSMYVLMYPCRRRRRREDEEEDEEEGELQG